MPEEVDLSTLDPKLNPHMNLGSSLGNVPASITADQVPDMVRAAAKKYDFDPEIALNVARTESNFNPQAHNDKTQAHGVMQLMPATAKELGVDINNPSENIDGGVRYLKQLWDKHKGDPHAALKAYGGFKTVDPDVYVNSIIGAKANPSVSDTWAPKGEEIPLDKLQSPGQLADSGPQMKGPKGPMEWMQYALNNLGPNISEHVRANLPAYGALLGPLALPEMGAMGALEGAAALVPRIGAAAARTATAYGGGVAGEVAQRTLAGHPPTDMPSIKEILTNQGPQAAIQAAFELPGIIKPASKFATSVYKAAFKPSAKELKQGVLDTLQKEKILPNSNATYSLAARHDEVNQMIDAEMAKQQTSPGIVPYGQQGVQANTAVLNPKMVQEFRDWVASEGKGKAFKGEWDSQAQDIIDTWNKDHPQDWIDFQRAREYKTDMRREANLHYGEKGDYKDQLYKKFSGLIDKHMEDINPNLGPLHERLRNIIDAEKTVEKFAARTEKSPIFNYSTAKFGLMGATGAGMGVYGAHNPFVYGALGAGAGLLSNPANYARFALMMKNHPELTRTMLGITPKMLAARPELYEQGKESIGNTTDNAMESLKGIFGQ